MVFACLILVLVEQSLLSFVIQNVLGINENK